MATNRKFIGGRTVGRINRGEGRVPFFSDLIKERDAAPAGYEYRREGGADIEHDQPRGRLDVDTPNGCAYAEGEDPGSYFEQGAGGGQGSTSRRKLFGGNRSGE